MASDESVHVAVLEEEVVEGLAAGRGGLFLDATVGAGGHARRILLASPAARVVGQDRDEVILEHAAKRLAEFGDRVRLEKADFRSMGEGDDGESFDGILADLGVSSLQLDDPNRGFSFRFPGPLDMRMDRSRGRSAADLVARESEEELGRIFRELGEERFWRRAARAIVLARRERRLDTTEALADVVRRAVARGPRQRIDPATRVFQALRIAVNDELSALDAFLDAAPNRLRIGGRLVVISFHSLEDRRVKHGFRQDTRLRVLTKKPIRPTQAEADANPRARSARLRVAERVEVES
ncbi:MAG: 16S rRNA (cytosine(1402)-N(4))-methyltransferase RsmH [Planctomycetota bacterium]